MNEINFKNPHTVLDSFESLRRHHLAKRKIREKQLTLIPVKGKAKILDIGIGPGLYLDFWLHHTEAEHASFTLIDGSEEALSQCLQIARASDAEHRVRVIQSDFTQLSQVQNEKFDIIFIGNTIEYIPEPIKYLQDVIMPLLSPGGILAVRDMDCGIMNVSPTDAALCSKVIFSRIQGCRSNSKTPETYHNPFLGRDLQVIVRGAGLTEIQFYPFYCEFRAPLTEAAKNYLSKLHTTWYVEDPLNLLTEEEKKTWKGWFDRKSPDSILELPEFYYIESEFMVVGKKE